MAKGGKRPGAGRKKGKKTQKTLEKEAALEHFRARIRKAVDPLFESQYTLAKGCSFVYRLEKGKKGEKSRHILLTNPREIELALNKIEDGVFDEDEYYFITTEKPDNNAIRDMLDRAFDKPQQGIKMAGTLNIAKVLDEFEKSP